MTLSKDQTYASPNEARKIRWVGPEPLHDHEGTVLAIVYFDSSHSEEGALDRCTEAVFQQWIKDTGAALV